MSLKNHDHKKRESNNLILNIYKTLLTYQEHKAIRKILKTTFFTPRNNLVATPAEWTKNEIRRDCSGKTGKP
jgi:hypothetical protein